RRQDTPRSKPQPQALPRPQPLPPPRTRTANRDLTDIEASLAQASGQAFRQRDQPPRQFRRDQLPRQFRPHGAPASAVRLLLTRPRRSKRTSRKSGRDDSILGVSS